MDLFFHVLTILLIFRLAHSLDKDLDKLYKIVYYIRYDREKED